MSTELAPQQKDQLSTINRRETIRPNYRVETGEHSYKIKVDLPGVSKDTAAITLENDTLTVEANRNHEVPDGWKLLHQEIPMADYRLRLQLNVRVDEKGIKASTKDGVLTIELPLAEEAKPRTITIQ